MEGIGFLYLLLIFLYFSAFLFSTLLILHFLKVKAGTFTVIIVGVLALLLSIIVINSQLLFDIPFGVLLLYTACIFIGYMYFAGFSGEKQLPREKEKS